MHTLADAYAVWKESGDDSKLRRYVKPVEHALGDIKSVVIRDSAVDALCHGAQLAIPGICQIRTRSALRQARSFVSSTL